MYKSPIDVLYKDVVTKLEDGILKAVQIVNITVDKQELIKALQYDRDSYSRGYMDGMNHENADVIPIEWIKEQKDKCSPYSSTALVLNGLLTEWERRKNECIQ